MNYSRLLEGKYAVITYGDNAIGAAVTELFARHGAVVAFGAQDACAADKLLAIIERGSPGSYYLPCDLSDAESVELFCAEINKRQPIVDILVNNPWIEFEKAFENTSDDDADLLLQVYQRSIMQTLRAFWPAMLKAGHCSVINISSYTAIKAVQGSLMLTIANGAVGGMTRVPAVEGGYREVRVNEILTGFIENRSDSTGDNKTPGGDCTGVYTGDKPTACGSARGNRGDTPTDGSLGNFFSQSSTDINGVDVACVANAALFLAGDMASYISGVSLSVSGGRRRMRLP